MSVYFLVEIEIHDPVEYETYLASCDDVFAKYGGCYLAVDKTPDVIEGSRAGVRTVLIEFPDEGEFRRWYDSPDYQSILKHRLAAADCRGILVKGKD